MHIVNQSGVVLAQSHYISVPVENAADVKRAFNVHNKRLAADTMAKAAGDFTRRWALWRHDEQLDLLYSSLAHGRITSKRACHFLRKHIEETRDQEMTKFLPLYHRLFALSGIIPDRMMRQNELKRFSQLGDALTIHCVTSNPQMENGIRWMLDRKEALKIAKAEGKQVITGRIPKNEIMVIDAGGNVIIKSTAYVLLHNRSAR